jgi:hypothetical protein
MHENRENIDGTSYVLFFSVWNHVILQSYMAMDHLSARHVCRVKPRIKRQSILSADKIGILSTVGVVNCTNINGWSRVQPAVEGQDSCRSTLTSNSEKKSVETKDKSCVPSLYVEPKATKHLICGNFNLSMAMFYLYDFFELRMI